MNSPKISLVIPILDEETSIGCLLESINSQTFKPDEIVVVDGGSRDETIRIVEGFAAGNSKIKLIKTNGATPGKGRNIGIENARNEWIALTDAGTRLDARWLQELVLVSSEDSEIDLVYGNHSPVIGNIFDRCAAFSYIRPQDASGSRGRFIASSLLRRKVWEAVGGFPDQRAAEDLMFMDEAAKQGFTTRYAPLAMVHWNLRPDLSSTYSKFVLYSKHNVWAGRQWDWHYGILRQYLLLIPILFLVFAHSPWWLLVLPLWLLARAAKRISAHRYEFGFGTLINPIVIVGTAFLILTIDAATFAGWIKALITKK